MLSLFLAKSDFSCSSLFYLNLGAQFMCTASHSEKKIGRFLVFLQEFCLCSHFSPRMGFEFVSVRSHKLYFKNLHTDLSYFSSPANHKVSTKPHLEPFLEYRPGKIHLRTSPDWRNSWSLSCFTGLDVKCLVLI